MKRPLLLLLIVLLLAACAGPRGTVRKCDGRRGERVPIGVL